MNALNLLLKQAEQNDPSAHLKIHEEMMKEVAKMEKNLEGANDKDASAIEQIIKKLQALDKKHKQIEKTASENEAGGETREESGLLAKIAAKKKKKGPAKPRPKGTILRAGDNVFDENVKAVKRADFMGKVKKAGKAVGAIGLLGGLGYAGYNALNNNEKAS